MPDQLRREARLGAVDLVVDGPERDADGLGVGLEGGVDGGPDAADDDAHQVHDRGEEERAGVLPLGDVLEQCVDGPGVQGVLQGGPGHDGDGALLCEPLEDVVEDHGARGTISRRNFLSGQLFPQFVRGQLEELAEAHLG